MSEDKPQEQPQEDRDPGKKVTRTRRIREPRDPAKRKTAYRQDKTSGRRKRDN